MRDVLVVSFQSLTADFAEGMAKVGYEVSRVLHARGELQSFVVSSKGPHRTPFPSRSVSYFARVVFRIFRYLDANGLMTPDRSRRLKEVFFDLSCVRLLRTDTRVLISTNAFMPCTFTRAKALGIRVILVPGNPEEGAIRNILGKEQRALSTQIHDAYTDDRRHDMYQRAMRRVDNVIGFSGVIAASFRMRFPDIQVIESHAALARREDLVRSYEKRPQTSGGNRKLVLGYIGYTVLLKGLHRLVNAWSEIDISDVELLVGGPIDANVYSLIEAKLTDPLSKNLRLLGQVTDINAFFRQIDVLVVPSLIDGSPLTILEALQRGIPVLTTRDCGYSQYIRNGMNGLVVGSELGDLIKGLQQVTQSSYIFLSPALPEHLASIEDLAVTVAAQVTQN